MSFVPVLAVPIECYNCLDKLFNTTCGDPRTDDELDILDTITCKTGACVKWTYYKNSEFFYSSQQVTRVQLCPRKMSVTTLVSHKRPVRRFLPRIQLRRLGEQFNEKTNTMSLCATTG